LKNQASTNTTTITDGLPKDAANEPNNSYDDLCDVLLVESMLKLMYD